MITISLFRNQQHKIVRFTVSGHAGYSERGTDIVCASVTTAAFTAVNGLTDVLKVQASVEVQEGYLSCRLPEVMTTGERQSADLLLESMVLTFENLAEQYGDYVTVNEIE